MLENYLEWSKDELIREVKKLKKRKKYGIVWEDKPEQVVELCKEKLPILAEDKSKEIETDKEKPVNILIEGDNYHTLSVLNYTHKVKIDVIYIDPPYNTGAQDWKYNNDYVDSEDSFRHSKWLSFMEKRIKLAKNLLKQSGFFIITVDHYELFNIGALCDEIFGESNRVGVVTIIINPKGRQNARFFSAIGEYMLIYAKNEKVGEFNQVVLDENVAASFNLEDQEGKYRLENFINARTRTLRINRPNHWYPIYISKDLKKITLDYNKDYYEVLPISANKEYSWKLIKESFRRKLKEEPDYFTANQEKGKISILHKFREQQRLNNVWTDKRYFSEFHGTNLIKKIFGKNIFNYPKSIWAVFDILKITSKEDAIILDFFAGSGTTGHATLELNKEDGGNRKFILCTNNENNICTEVCYPRVEKVIKGYKTLQGEKIEGLSTNLKYFKTDFVDAQPTDRNKRKLVDKSTEMLCLKEDCFDKVKRGHEFKIFKNSQDKHLGIIYDDEGIDEFKKEAKRLKKKFVVYVFSLDESAREEEFEDVASLVELKPIPAVILNVYKRIFK